MTRRHNHVQEKLAPSPEQVKVKNTNSGPQLPGIWIPFAPLSVRWWSKSPHVSELQFLQGQNWDNNGTYPIGLSGRRDELVHVSHSEHSLVLSRNDTWYLSEPFHNDDLIGVSPSSSEVVEADATALMQQASKERCVEGSSKSGPEPLEPSLVVSFRCFPFYPEQTDSVTQTNPGVGEGTGTGVLFQWRQEKHSVAKACLA